MSIVHTQGIGDHHATAHESGLSNKTFEFRDQPRRVLIVEGDKTALLMSETLQGQGFDVMSVDEANMPLTIPARHEFTGTFTATVADDPFGRDRNGLIAADRERAAWNEAVDQRKAEKRMHRLERQWGAS
jgi:hypothetical protein